MGAFDDLIQGTNSPQAPSQPKKTGGAFDDLIAQTKQSESTPHKFGMAMTGIPETALALGSGMLGSAIGGLGGIGAALSKAAGITDVAPEEVVKSIQQGMTYQPRTELGQQGVKAIGQIATLGGLLPAAAEKIGGAVQDITGSPLLATGAHMATEAIPQLLLTKGAVMAAPAVRAAAETMGTTVKRAISPLFERFAKQPSPEIPGIGAAEAGAREQRLARMESLPFPPKPTEGTLSRNFEQQQFERETAKLPEQGKELRERDAGNNVSLLKNFDAFREETGGVAPDPIAVGKSVNTALANRMAAVKQKVDAQYRIAEKQGAMDQPIDIAPLTEWLTEKAPESINAPIIKSVGEKLVQFGAAERGPEGAYIATGKALPIKTLEEIRKMINEVGADSPNNIRMGSQTKGVIDSLTEGQGGELYKAARAEHAKYAQEFQNQSAISKLLATKPGTTDRAIAYEDMWKKAVPGDYSIQDLRNLRTTLFKAGPEGGQAWKDLGGATIDYLKQQATKTTAMDELGNPIVGAAGMRKAMQSIGTDKLELLFGRNGASRLKDLADTIDDLKIAPPGAVNWSNTAATIMAALADVGISGLIGAPLPITSAVKFAMTKVKNAKLRAKIDRALHPS